MTKRSPRRQSCAPLIATFLFWLLQSLILQITTIAAISTVEDNDCFLDDRCTLERFKDSLPNQGEPNLASWNKVNVLEWEGVTWGNGTTFVERLELGGRFLSGQSIYPLLQDGLPMLKVLNISNNYFNGTLPATLQIGAALQFLDLSNNSFTGELPLNIMTCNQMSQTEHSALSPAQVPEGHPVSRMYKLNLAALNFSTNIFTGSLTESLLEAIPSIEYLDVSRNHLTGSLPDKVGHLYNLSSFSIEGNNITGQLPAFSGNCTELRQLKFSENNFKGSLPLYPLADLPNLEELHFFSNHFTGMLEIPSRAGAFQWLKVLDLSDNFLEGPLPFQLGNLSNLETLTLQYNGLNGTLPVGLSLGLGRMKYLNLNYNLFSGELPPTLGNWSSLTSLSLGDNIEMSGPIPSELGNLTNLAVLSLINLRLQSSLPRETGQLGNLVLLDVGYNSLQGPVPSTLCDLSKLQVLFLNNNQLSGGLLDCLWNYSSLWTLDLSSNFFNGSIPGGAHGLKSFMSSENSLSPEISTTSIITGDIPGAIRFLSYQFPRSPMSIDLSGNYLSGEIPASFGKFKTLQVLLLKNNSLSGLIPPALGNAFSLLLVDFSLNNLGGQIPFELTDLHFLSQFNVSFNNLEGQIPQANQFLAFPALWF